METNRYKLVLLCIALVFTFIFIAITQLATGSITQLFYWGIPIGLLFGLATSLYLSEQWDPELLQPINPESRASLRILWVVPLGVAIASITSNYLSKELVDLLGGVALTWVSVIFLYAAIQVWRYRPR